MYYISYICARLRSTNNTTAYVIMVKTQRYPEKRFSHVSIPERRQIWRVSRTICCLIFAGLVTACVTNFNEVHYFTSVGQAGDGKPTNYFRLTINGKASFAKTRYVSGYYDERAVDLFFNELKTTPGTVEDIAKIFIDNQKDPGTEDLVKPLSPTPQNGTLVMLFSTNANSVANAIGSFAESHAVADAITNLVNRDAIVAARRNSALASNRTREATAISNELKALFDELDTTDREELNRGYMRILNAIGNHIEPGVRFADFKDADSWLTKNVSQ